MTELVSSRALKWCGALLSFTHVITFLFWTFTQKWVGIASDKAGAVCHSYFMQCEVLRIFTQTQLQIILVIYLLCAAATTALFFTSRIRFAFYAFIALNIFKFTLFSFDYRLMGNYHYMPFWASLVFILGSNRKILLPFTICLFYFGAGLLKFNYEWLSGSALVSRPMIRGWFLEVACAYVVVLEVVLVWGLLSISKRWRWITLGQLALFHLFSYTIVGWFYPAIMLAMLAILPALWAEDASRSTLSPKSVLKFDLPKSFYVFSSVFVFLQLVPFFQNGDAALTGELRQFSLNMLDARVRCRALFLANFEGGVEEITPANSGFGARIKCDPLLYFQQAKKACATQKNEKGFKDLDWHLMVKKTSEVDFRQIVKLEKFCSSNIQYSFWGGNDWIKW